MFFSQIILSAASYGLGIAVGRAVLHQVRAETIPAPDPVSLSGLLIAFAVATVAFFTVVKIKKRAGGWLMQALYAAAIFLGVEAALAVFIGDLPAAIIAVVVLVVQWRTRTVAGHNILFLTAIAGIGGIVGVSISLRDAAILLAILAVYDVVAVYGTKHMVTMAEGMFQSGALFGVVVPRHGRTWLQRLDPIAQEKLDNLHGRRGRGHNERVEPSSNTARDRNGDSVFFLGGGDIALPMIVVVAALRQSMQAALVLAGFALIGYVVMHSVFSHIGNRRPMPALPPIAGMVLFGLLFI